MTTDEAIAYFVEPGPKSCDECMAAGAFLAGAHQVLRSLAEAQKKEIDRLRKALADVKQHQESIVSKNTSWHIADRALKGES